MRIALDAMGGDHAPFSTVNGAIEFIRENGQKSPNVDLYGHQEELQKIIDDSGFDSDKLSIIENKIHMTKNQSRQDPLNYGIRINNRLAFLMADSQRGDFPPTDQSIEFFKVIKEELNHELASLNKLLNTYVSQINNMIEDNNIKFISF